jgi:hypothetical protein
MIIAWTMIVIALAQIGACAWRYYLEPENWLDLLLIALAYVVILFTQFGVLYLHRANELLRRALGWKR